VARIKDWLHGVRQVQPDQNTHKALQDEPLTEAERYRQIYHMITATREEGGASITPKLGEWENVDAIFPLHDHERNRKWLNSFSSKTFLTPEDLDQIRDVVGEKVRNF
jgi:anoctamin-10